MARKIADRLTTIRLALSTVGLVRTGRLPLKQEDIGSNPIRCTQGQIEWKIADRLTTICPALSSVGLVVRTPDFHSGDEGFDPPTEYALKLITSELGTE